LLWIWLEQAGDMLDRDLQQAMDSLHAGDYARVEAWCQKALGEAPRDPDALRLLGILRLQGGRAVEAIPVLRTALQADAGNLSALDALSAALMAVADYAQAEEVIRRALAAGANLPVASVRLGLALAAQGKWEQAAQAYADAANGDPQFAEAHHNLGHALMELHRPQEAAACFRRALALNPRNPDTHAALGAALHDLGRPNDSMDCCRRALELDANHALAHVNLGSALLELGELERSRKCFERAVALQPNLARARTGLAAVLHERGRWDEAVVHYELALAIDAGSVEAQYNLALARLYRQQFEQAWPGFERRLDREDAHGQFRRDGATVALYKKLPRWRGPVNEGSREVAIWAEQGIGDQVLFSTLIPELIGAGVPFIYEVDRRLLGAYQRAFPGHRFVPIADPPQSDLRQVPRVLLSGSLPGLFRRSRADFLRQPEKLLSALPERVACYQGRFGALGPGLKVALSWHSRREGRLGSRKSVPLIEFAPLLRVPGVHFVDAQYGDTAAERRAVEDTTVVPLLHFDEVDYYNDLEEVLAILTACDLVITASNATAHFAGALGKRTWLLYPADNPPFHYWVHGGSYRSLWYPSVEIVTAPHLAEWTSLLARAAERLRSVSGSSPAWSRSAGAGEKTSALSHEPDRDPSNARVWSELAHSLRMEGRLDEARRAAIQAIEFEPELASAWFNLGASLQGDGKTSQCIEIYRKTVELKPDFAEAWSNLGGVLAALGDPSGEIDAYRRALAINPRLAPVWSNLGNALQGAGQLGEAESACRRATELDPSFAAAWSNLGNALTESGQHEEAVRACETAQRLDSGSAEAWSALGGALHGAGRYDEAILAHRRAIEIQPGNAQLHFNLGVTLQHCGQSTEAIACFRRALAIRPDHAEAHCELGLALLSTGELREGWEEYEWRWRRPGVEPKRHDFALWNGDASKPCRLLLWAEQGIGDQIIYASMIADLVSSPMGIALEVDPRLAPLYRRSFPYLTVHPRREPPLVNPADYDRHAPLASLGRWLRRSFENFPRHGGYLKPDPSRVEAYRNRLGGNQATRIVGISWKSTNQEFGRHKSTELVDWLGILQAPRVRFVDLQYGDTASERGLVEQQAGARFEHLPDLDLYHDLEGLAALCAACDLVITVSNVTAHVAGALGRPVWLLVPKANGKLWYWFSGRTDSPWYPSMRIFTQQTPGNWGQVLDAVEMELAAFLKGG
jgi:tetratricopeptide (TPR) repeat protein